MSHRVSFAMAGASFALFLGYFLLDVFVLEQAVQSGAQWAVQLNTVLVELGNFLPKIHRYQPYFRQVFENSIVERYIRLTAACAGSAAVILLGYGAYRVARHRHPLFVTWVDAGLKVSSAEHMRAMMFVLCICAGWTLLIGLTSAHSALALSSFREPVTGFALILSPIGCSALLIGAAAFALDLTVLIHQLRHKDL